MKSRILLLLLALALPLAGCKKISAFFHRKPPVDSKQTAAQQNAAAPAPSPAAATAAAATPSATPAQATAVDQKASVVVLCYHRFEEVPHDTLAISPAEFEQEMKQLKDSGITVIPMKDFLAWKRGEKNIPSRSAVISIDDGYVSGYEVAWPILKKYNYPFTMFVYLNYINKRGKSINWDQLAEMRDAGVDIESHTVSHKSLRRKNNTRKSDQEYTAWLHDELFRSKQTLEQQLGIHVSCIAFPYGEYDEKVREMAKQAGYEACFTVYGQRIGYSSANDILGRYAVESKQPGIFQAALKGNGGTVSSGETIAQLAAASMITQPMDGETINEPKPLIKANLATMGQLDPGSVEMRLSGVGLVPAQYDANSKTISYQCTQKLRDRSCTVIISAKSAGKKVETRWTFNFDPAASASTKSADNTTVSQTKLP